MINIALFELIVNLALGLLVMCCYTIVGIIVLSLLERSRRVEIVSADITGPAAWISLLVWPLTAVWLLWHAWQLPDA